MDAATSTGALGAVLVCLKTCVRVMPVKGQSYESFVSACALGRLKICLTLKNVFNLHTEIYNTFAHLVYRESMVLKCLPFL